MQQHKRILVFRTCDADNYGDLLFPLIARQRLSDFADICFVASDGNENLWSDGVEAQSMYEVLSSSTSVDGVLVGGGNVIHGLPGHFTHDDRCSIELLHTYPARWFGAAYLSAKQNCPLVFSAPGLTLAVRESPFAEFIKAAIDLAEYVNASDEGGTAVLSDVSPSHTVFGTPDTALDVTKLWSRKELSEAYRGAFLSRGKSVPRRALAVHVRKTSLPERTAPVSRHLDEIADQTDTVPILVSFGPCHSDGDAAREVASRMRCETLLLDRPNSLREVTACLAHSVGYLGSSLHGCLVASAFRRPSQLVVCQPKPRHKKAADLLLTATPLLDSWLDVEPPAFSKKIVEGRECVRPDARARLDQHWEFIQEFLTKGVRSNEQQGLAAIHAQQQFSNGPNELLLGDYLSLLDDFRSLIEPLKQANFVVAGPKKEKSWSRKLLCALALRLSR